MSRPLSDPRPLLPLIPNPWEERPASARVRQARAGDRPDGEVADEVAVSRRVVGSLVVAEQVHRDPCFAVPADPG